MISGSQPGTDDASWSHVTLQPISNTRPDITCSINKYHNVPIAAQLIATELPFTAHNGGTLLIPHHNFTTCQCLTGNSTHHIWPHNNTSGIILCWRLWQIYDPTDCSNFNINFTKCSLQFVKHDNHADCIMTINQHKTRPLMSGG